LQATPGKIWDSNKTTLAALLTQRGVDYIDLGISRDDSDSVYNKLVEAFDREVDVLITTGSVSMGERDVLKRILEVGFDATVIFGRVHIKPGKPMSFLTCDWKGSKKIVFALPGNPVSAFVTCFLFVIPAIQSISGRQVQAKGLKAHHRTMRAKLKSSKPLTLDSRPEFVRAVISFESDFPEVELIPGNQCSSRLMSVRGADVLVLLPPASPAKTHIFPGENVTAFMLS
jgi:gephyrin